jgi:hypothetical protein
MPKSCNLVLGCYYFILNIVLLTISMMLLIKQIPSICPVRTSAVTLSQDLTLRKTIRKSVMEQSRLLDSIATAQMERVADLRSNHCQKNICRYEGN